MPGTMRLQPADDGSLSLVSAVEVALLEAIATQDLDGVLRGRLLGRHRGRRGRAALVLAATAASPALMGRDAAGSGGGLLRRDRSAADELGRIGAVGRDRLRVRPA